MSDEYILQVSNVSHEVSLSDGSRLPLLQQVSLDVKRRIGGDYRRLRFRQNYLNYADGDSGCATQGSIKIAGQDVSALDEEARAAVRGRSIAFVFQNFHLLDGLTALENVLLPLEVRGVTERPQVAAEYLQAVGLGERQQHYPAQLSGGEQQRVALARPSPPGAAIICRRTHR